MILKVSCSYHEVICMCFNSSTYTEFNEKLTDCKFAIKNLRPPFIL